MIRSIEKKIFECSKEGKNKKQKKETNNNLEEDNSQEKENKMNYKRKDSKLNKKEKYENESNINLEDEKKEIIQTNKKIIEVEDKYEKKLEKKIYEDKNHYKFYSNYSMDDYIENEYLLNNKNIKRRYKENNKNKYSIIYILYFYYFIIAKIFSSQFIKCCHRKIELSSSYINLKINATGIINIYSNEYLAEKPNIITINNVNHTINDINNIETFTNSEKDIINITLIWNNSITSTYRMFYECDDIIEIDLSHFDTSNVENMNYMFSGCTSLTSLNLTNFNTSSV